MKPNQLAAMHEQLLSASEEQLKEIRAKLGLSGRDYETLLIQATRENNWTAAIDCYLLIGIEESALCVTVIHWFEYAKATKKPSLDDFNKKYDSWFQYFEPVHSKAEALDFEFARDPKNDYLRGPTWRNPYRDRVFEFSEYLQIEGWKIPAKDLIDDLFQKAPKWHKPELLLEGI